MENLVAWMGGTLISAFVGSYLSAYMKRKGENQAIHEDLQRLVEQVRVTTETAKVIEGRISQDVWDTQRRWEMKRDVLHAFVVAAYVADEALLALQNISEAVRQAPFADELVEEQTRAIEAGNASLRKLEEQRLLALLACGAQFNSAAHRLSTLAKEVYSDLVDNPGAYDDRPETMKDAIAGALAAARIEIGYTSDGATSL